MIKKFLRLSAVFTAIMLIIVFLSPSLIYADSTSDVNAFVTRFYQTCLNRLPDSGGLASWTNGLLSGNLTGAQVANGFIFSDELKSKNLSNNQFLEILYSSFFDRLPDPGGLSDWLSVMSKGASRQYVLAGFVNSDEFRSLCANFGIRTGSLSGGSLYSAPAATPQISSGIENSLLNLINQIRAQNGVPYLTGNASLTNIARSRSSEMINRNYFSHSTPDGKNIYNILIENGIGYAYAGENIYQCSPAYYGSESAIINTWLSSSFHRANLLNSEYRQVGIGIVDGGGKRIVTIVLLN